MKITLRKKIIILVSSLTLIAVSGGTLALAVEKNVIGEKIVDALPQELLCLDKSSFSTLRENIVVPETGYNVLNEDGTIKYFYDNFDQYVNNTVVIEDFEDLNNLNLIGAAERAEMDGFHINGENSLRVILSEASSSTTVFKVLSSLQQSLDFGSLQRQGVFTMWVHAPQPELLNSVTLRLIDADGNNRTLRPIENSRLAIPDHSFGDGPYPDIAYKNQISAADEWTDYQITEGWNFLFWRNEPAFYSEEGNFDINDVRLIEVTSTVNANAGNKSIYFDDLRLVSGLQTDDNVLWPNWHPPHGRPQYGIFDVDTDENNGGSIKLLNVRQTQYPSNGDHAVMISEGLTPENFAMRVRFKTEDVGMNGNVENTWFRVAYDYDPEWDPGHDYFGFFSTLEWERAGLITVIPIHRFTLQDQEPSKESI